MTHRQREAAKWRFYRKIDHGESCQCTVCDLFAALADVEKWKELAKQAFEMWGSSSGNLGHLIQQAIREDECDED